MNDMPVLTAPPLPITDIKIYVQNDGRLRAFAAIVLADCFKINGLKIIEGKAGLFVAMPSRKTRDGSYQDIAHPINTLARAYVERKVLRAYLSESGDEGTTVRVLGPRGLDPLSPDDEKDLPGELIDG